MNSRGIIFVATQHDRYVDEAVLAARHAKQHAPGLPVTLFTDRSPPSGAHFDRVERITGATVGDARANAQINRFIGLTRTPYEHTLYLDTEALVVSGAVSGIFDMLDGYDLALVEDVAGASDALALTGRRMFNCGVMLYQRDTATAWLEPWRAAALRNLALAQETPVPVIPEISAVTDPAKRKWLLEVDKIALLGVLQPDGGENPVRVRAMPEAWNFRKQDRESGTRIHHPHERLSLNG